VCAITVAIMSKNTIKSIIVLLLKCFSIFNDIHCTHNYTQTGLQGHFINWMCVLDISGIHGIQTGNKNACILAMKIHWDHAVTSIIMVYL